MKIWWHHAIPYLDVYKTYDEILKKHINMLSGNGKVMTVDHYWNEKGSRALQFHSLDLMNKAQCVENMCRAEESGYDAAVIGCSMDVGVDESKEAVNMPVVGLAEAGMIFACLLGKRFSEITFGKKLKTRIEERAEEIGLRHRLASVRVIEMQLEEAGEALSNPKLTEELRESFIKESKKAIEEDGAEVIVPGCGLLIALSIREKIARIDGTQVPVVDSTIAALGLATTLFQMKKEAGVTLSRAGVFATPSQQLLNEARKYYR